MNQEPELLKELCHPRRMGNLPARATGQSRGFCARSGQRKPINAKCRAGREATMRLVEEQDFQARYRTIHCGWWSAAEFRRGKPGSFGTGEGLCPSPRRSAAMGLLVLVKRKHHQ